MNAILAAWLPDVIGDVVTVAPHDVGVEARENQWSFSLTADEAAGMAVQDVEDFILAVVHARSASLLQNPLPRGGMTFYCWFDEMACQLRFSIVSAKRDGLPFACTLKESPLSQIVSDFLTSNYHNGIPWSEFSEEVPPGIESPPASLPVWSVAVP